MSLKNKVIQIKTIDFSLPTTNITSDEQTNVNRIDAIELALLTLQSDMDKYSTTILNVGDSVNNTKIENKINNLENIITELKDSIKKSQENILNVEDPFNNTKIENKVNNLENIITELKDSIKKSQENIVNKFNNIDLVKNAIETSIEKGMKIEIDKPKNINLNKDLIELDMGIRENKLSISQLENNISKIVTKNIENINTTILTNNIDQFIENKLNDIIVTKITDTNNTITNRIDTIENTNSQSNILNQVTAILDEQLNERLGYLEAKIINNVTSELTLRINNIIDLKFKELQNKDTVIEETIEETVEETVEDTVIEDTVEETVIEETVEETVIEDTVEKTAEEINKEQELANEIAKQHQESIEKEENNELKKILRENISVYPTFGFTLYCYLDDSKDITLCIFIKKDGIYELRCKQDSFKHVNDKIFTSLNIQLEKSESDYLVVQYKDNIITRLNKSVYKNLPILNIGENNLTDNLDDLPTLLF